MAGFSETLHKLYSRLNTSPEDKPPPKEVTRLVKAAKRTMAHWARRPYKTDEVGRFAAKIRNGIDHWFTFTTTPWVEPTNNRAERALREHVVQRKIIGTLRNQRNILTRNHHNTACNMETPGTETIKDASEQPKPQMAKQLNTYWRSGLKLPFGNNGVKI